ncbi:MAG TPA: hypothetical protein VNJ09_01305 [Chthonomonadales bacterium]|nr:hypothetical protein [Chthonomonadales bacterium]
MKTTNLHRRTPDPEIERMVRQLSTQSHRRRREAEEALREQADEHVEDLLAIATREMRRWRRGSEILHNFLSATICFGMVYATGILFSHPPNLDPWFGPEALGMALGGIVLLLVKMALRFLRPAPVRAARALTQVEDTRAIGLLLDALPLGNAAFRNEIQEALTRLLPYLPPGDYLRLSDPQRERLYGLLLTGKYCVRLAVLNLLKRVADGAALPHVRTMARFDKDPYLRSAAADFATFLEARFGEHHVILLRPVQKPANDHLLLRPAQGRVEVNPSVLLLAAQAPGPPLSLPTANKVILLPGKDAEG